MLTSGHDYLNRKLPGETPWLFWLASESPENAPKEADGTAAPINDLPKFIGKNLDDLAKFLSQDLSSAFLKEDVFVVLDDRTAKDQSVKICHLDKNDGDGGHGREVPEVQVIRATPRAAAFHLQANSSWIEMRGWWEGYKREGNDVLDVSK